MLSEAWAKLLRQNRQQLGLSQRELAQRAGVSAQTLKAYELGLRRPSRTLLASILDALKIDASQHNQILMAAGFAPDSRVLSSTIKGMFDLHQARVEIERYPWPAFLQTDTLEVVAANRTAQRLWGIELDRDFSHHVQRNLLSVASDPRFAERCLNWEEVVGGMISLLKGHPRGPESLDSPSGYFQAVLEQFAAGDPKYLSRLIRLWNRVPAAKPRVRRSYHVLWAEPELGRIRFYCLTSLANHIEGLTFNDWIPQGARGWSALEVLKKGRRPPA
jgi:transcriptional regulator with XRE-family HTH domain